MSKKLTTRRDTRWREVASINLPQRAGAAVERFCTELFGATLTDTEDSAFDLLFPQPSALVEVKGVGSRNRFRVSANQLENQRQLLGFVYTEAAYVVIFYRTHETFGKRRSMLWRLKNKGPEDFDIHLRLNMQYIFVVDWRIIDAALEHASQNKLLKGREFPCQYDDDTLALNRHFFYDLTDGTRSSKIVPVRESGEDTHRRFSVMRGTIRIPTRDLVEPTNDVPFATMLSPSLHRYVCPQLERLSVTSVP